MSILKKLARIFLNILAALLLLILLIWTVVMIGKFVYYRDYMKDRVKESKIPHLNEGFVPQGLACTEDGLFLHSGYNEKATEIHLSKDGVQKHIIPLTPEGVPCQGHAGGISVAGDYVYVSYNYSLTVFRLSEMLAAADNSSLKAIDVIPVESKASFCFSNDELLYVGEFFRTSSDKINEDHAYTTPAGDAHRAWVACYKLEQDGSLSASTPTHLISIPHKAQGIAVKNGVYILSSSWGMNDSSLFFYDGIIDSGETKSLNGEEIPLYYLDSSNLFKTVKMPAFSEGIDVVGDRVYITFESACNKYIIGKFFFAYNVVSYPIPKKN